MLWLVSSSWTSMSCHCPQAGYPIILSQHSWVAYPLAVCFSSRILMLPLLGAPPERMTTIPARARKRRATMVAQARQILSQTSQAVLAAAAEAAEGLARRMDTTLVAAGRGAGT